MRSTLSLKMSRMRPRVSERLAMDERGRTHEMRLLLDALPRVHQRGELALDRLGRDVLADRADDDAAGVVGEHPFDEGAESLRSSRSPILRLTPTRDANGM